MKPLYKSFAFFFLILLLGFFISPTNKTEIFFGALTPFIASIIEVFFLLRAVKVDLMMTTKILMIGFILKFKDTKRMEKKILKILFSTILNL